MVQLLGNIPFVCASMDDILISGLDDDQHLDNLNEVLKRLAKAGVRLNRDKCVFMYTEVVYLGYKIDAEGLRPVPKKVDAIAMAPSFPHPVMSVSFGVTWVV